MILFYIDESGTGLKDPQSPHFLLAGVAVEAQAWPKVDGEFSSLKRRLVSFVEPEDWEIKGRHLRMGQELFGRMNWNERARIFIEIAETISELPCRIFIVQVDKRLLPKSIESDDLYIFAFWRLLEELNHFLKKSQETGLLMIDARSSLHSSVQDRRLVDAYRKWIGSHLDQARFVDLPWFGFSEFYAGLQIADFSAYLLDATSNEKLDRGRSEELAQAYERIQSKTLVIRVP